MESPMSPPRRRQPDQRRDQLLDAAERVLLERGLRSTTIADVADAAGVAKGTLYLYFESKDALLASLRARHLERFAAALADSAPRSAGKPSKRLDRFVAGLFHFSVEHAVLHHLLFHESGFSEADALAGARSMLAEIIRGGQGLGDFAPGDAEQVAGFLLNGLHGLLLEMLRSPQANSSVQVLAQELAHRAAGAT